MSSKWTSKNYYSYLLVDEFMWLGLGSIVNDFRKHILKLPAIRLGEHGESVLHTYKVPISHMWSPSFVPKCEDWPSFIDVVGEFAIPIAESTYQPHQKLIDYLANGEKPIYVGFGSMVIENPTKLVEIIKEAAKTVQCRIILQSGWTKYAEDYTLISDEVFVVGAMPHDWLLYQVSGVIHHGGAGTTSAGLRAG